MTIDEVRALTKDFPAAKAHFESDPSSWGYDTVVIDGDLYVDGDLDTFKRGWAGFVVNGSLRVSGLFRDSDDPATGVFVLGSMKVGRVVTSGALGVAGDLVVEEILVGDCNEYSADIRGNVTTPLFVPENHHFEIGGELFADAVVGYDAEWRVPKRLKKRAAPLPEQQWRDVLVPEVLDVYEEDGEILEVQLLQADLRKRVLDGQPVVSRGGSTKARAM